MTVKVFKTVYKPCKNWRIRKRIEKNSYAAFLISAKYLLIHRNVFCRVSNAYRPTYKI